MSFVDAFGSVSNWNGLVMMTMTKRHCWPRETTSAASRTGCCFVASAAATTKATEAEACCSYLWA